MVKYDLRQQGFSMEERFTKKSVVNTLWAVIALVMIFGTVIAIMLSVGYINYTKSEDALIITSDPDQIPLHFLIALGMLILYFALKLGMTVLFCSDRQNSINLKVLEGKAMPVCFCREALKTWQIVLMYLVPFVIIYGVMFGVCAYQVYEEMEYGFIIMLLFMSFFMAFDLALVIYVLAIKIKDKIDYISIDYHIYEVTLYKNTYISRGGITAKSYMKALESKSKKRMFTTMTTCLNPQCENYARELDISKKICSCGCHIYKAEVLTNVVSCLNPECGNYGHELKKDIEVCSLCGGKTGKLSFKFKPSLKIPAIVTALTAAGVFSLIHWIMSVFGLNNLSESGRPNYVLNIVNLLGYCSLPIGIITAIASKSKLAIIIAVLSALLAVGFVNFVL